MKTYCVLPLPTLISGREIALAHEIHIRENGEFVFRCRVKTLVESLVLPKSSRGKLSVYLNFIFFGMLL